MIYCTQCGSENDTNSKFCRNCGAKLEQPTQEEQFDQTEGAFSRDEVTNGYEKITDAEEKRPAPIPYQEEIKINNDRADSQSFNQNTQSAAYTSSNNYYDASTPYYSTDKNETKKGGGCIGFSIAALVCGILSVLCCCLTLFSALLAIAAVVLGIITLCFKFDGKGMAIAGIIMGGIGLLLVVFTMIAGASGIYNEFIDELQYELY